MHYPVRDYIRRGVSKYSVCSMVVGDPALDIIFK